MRFQINYLSSKLEALSLMIKQSSSNGKWHEVLINYNEMQRAEAQSKDPSLFPLVLKACANLSSKQGKPIHGCLIKQGFESFTSIANSIMDFYVKSGDVDSALKVFDCLKSRDSISWNIMIYGHSDKGLLSWFSKARFSGFEPNISTLILVIKACRDLKVPFEGLLAHGYLVRSGFLAIPSIQNSLLSIYAEANIEYARKLFDEMTEKDVISWSVLIASCVQNQEAQLGLRLFREMMSEVGVEPDGISAVSALKACTVEKAITMGRLIHGFVIYRGFCDDVFIRNSLVDMYSKCNDVASALEVFNEMPTRNTISWNSMLSGFVHNEKHSEALSLFYSMQEEQIEVDEVALVNVLKVCKYFVSPSQCKSIHCVVIRQGYDSNELALNSLIDAYVKCNLVEVARKLFDGMKERDVVSWSTMIAGFTRCGKPYEAIGIFQEMSLQAQEKPNSVTIINLLESCSVLLDLKRSKWAHGIAIRKGLASDVAVGTAIVDMYSKCGNIEAAKKAFDQILHKNVISWSALIAGYGMNGLPGDALALLAEMKRHGLSPNEVTTLSVLSACSHGGLVKEGLSLLKTMAQDHEVEPGLEHYSCVVDLLSRAGKLENAIELIENIPGGLKAGASAWGAVLSACRIHQNSEVGEGAASHVLALEPLNSAGYFLASNMFSADKLWDSASTTRRLMKERGVKVVSGYSLVHVGNKACRFIAGDTSNPQSFEINSVIKQLHRCMKINEDHHLM